MKTFLLIGLGHLGNHLAKYLCEEGHEVMGVDVNDKKVDDAMDYLTNAQIGDSTNPYFLQSLGISGFDVCIVAISGDFQSSLETTSLLKEMGAKFVVARAERDVQEKFLLRNGADEVIYPEKDVAHWAAIKYGSDRILDYMELDKTHGIFEVPVPKEWIGKSIMDLDIRKTYQINIFGIRNNGILDLVVSPDKVLTKDDSLLIIGEQKDLEKCFHI